MEKEIWKDVPNYEEDYMVSSRGRVKSMKLNKERILKPGLSNSYLQLRLCREGKIKTFTVHKLVAMAFLGHVPCGFKLVVDHIDGNRTNNNLSNLQIITNRENTSNNKKGGSSKYVGVSLHKPSDKWISRIQINDKQKHLGTFKTEIEAHNAYQEALKNLF